MTQKIIHLTEHAKYRAIRRYMMPPEKLEEFAYKAVTEGYSIGDAPSPEIREYLERKIKGGNKAYVYSGYVFIFSVGARLRLITSFRMPKYYFSTI